MDYSDPEISALFDHSSDEYKPNESSSEDSQSINEENDDDPLFQPPEFAENGSEEIVPGRPNHLNEAEPLAINVRKKKHFSPKIKNSRKRTRNPENWKKNKAAISREKGLSYKSYKGNDIPEKSVAVDGLCPQNCRLKCSEKFTIEQREHIKSAFYKLDVNSKNALLFSSIKSGPPGRKRKGAMKHKKVTYQYFVTYGGNQKLVCKRALISLYRIGEKKVRIIQDKIKDGKAAPSPDKRGRHSNRPNKISDDVKAYIVQHISSFPAESSHYSRLSNIHKKYISPLLSVPKMHSLYLELCTSENKPPEFRVKECYYRSVFVNEFNLSFSKPRSDTCSTCDAGISNEEHVENYHSAFDSMKIDRETARTSNNVAYITIDLQQTQPLPKLTTSKAFYLRQLWFYNFGIHIIAGDVEKAVFCTWSEEQGSKGSTDILSSLLTALEMDEVLKSKDHLIIWSDSCSGQNKNFLLVCLYQHLVQRGSFKVIDHKFPEVGHTYLDSDRDFGIIEKNLRKHETIFLPEQYRNVIAKSSKRNLVIDMTNHFRKTENLERNLKLYNRKKDELKQQVPFRDGIKWVRVETYGSYLFKESYDYNTPFKQVNIMRNLNDSGAADLPEHIERDPTKTHEISKEKIEDIKQQLKFIPMEHQWFYRNVIDNNEL